MEGGHGVVEGNWVVEGNERAGKEDQRSLLLEECCGELVSEKRLPLWVLAREQACLMEGWRTPRVLGRFGLWDGAGVLCFPFTT